MMARSLNKVQSTPVI